MAGSATITLKVEVSGLGVTTNLPIEFTHSVVPTESAGPLYTKIGNTAQVLNLIGIDPDDILGVLIISRVDEVGVMVSLDGTGTPYTTAGYQVIDGANNEAVYLNFANGLKATDGDIMVEGESADSAIE